MMDESKTPPTHLRSCRYLTLYRGVLDLSIVQGPFSVAPCQTLISRFATFASQYGGGGGGGGAAWDHGTTRLQAPQHPDGAGVELFDANDGPPPPFKRRREEAGAEREPGDWDSPDRG
jgi:hypothetical protein